MLAADREQRPARSLVGEVGPGLEQQDARPAFSDSRAATTPPLDRRDYDRIVRSIGRPLGIGHGRTTALRRRG